MFDGRDFDAAERMVDDWQDGFEQRAVKARDLAARMSRLTASSRSADGLIEVSIGRSGELIDLRLDEAIRQQSAAETCRDILATVAAARAALVGKAAAVVAETVGADSESGRAVLAGYLSAGSEDPSGTPR